jgi:hypothetical protein
MEGYAAELYARGVVVVPVFPKQERGRVNKQFMDTLAEFPEYVPGATQYVLGGFGALGNPSSFHAPAVRGWRRRIHDEVTRPLFASFAEEAELGEGYNLEVLFDRMGLRTRTQGALGKEQWHRDVYGGAAGAIQDTDLVFGGWVNMNYDTAPATGDKKETRMQYFWCAPGTHNTPEAIKAQREGGQFAKIEDAAELANCAARVQKIEVPPGHCVIFYQRLAHQVCPGVQPVHPSVRLFLGHRLTKSDVPLNPPHVFENLDIPIIPSGQFPVMFSTNHYAMPGHLDRLRAQLRPEVLLPSPKSLKFQGDRPRLLPSLRSRGMWTGAQYDYSPEDRALMSPQPL